MIKTILIGRDRKSGKDVLLAGTEVPMDKQVALYKEFKGDSNDHYSNVNLFHAQDYKKPLKFITSEESVRRNTPAEPAEVAATPPQRQSPPPLPVQHSAKVLPHKNHRR